MSTLISVLLVLIQLPLKFSPFCILLKIYYLYIVLKPCRNLENGIIGRCCRDPNYVDPWPTGNLPANYSGGFDELGFPTFLNTAKRSTTTEKPEPSLVPDNTIFSPNVLVPPKSATEDEGKSSQPTATCGIRNKVFEKIIKFKISST